MTGSAALPSNSQSPTYFAALQWSNAGCAVIPPKQDGTKAPIGQWKQYQHTLPTESELAKWYSMPQDGVGVITGAISGGLEMVEAEGRAIADNLHKRVRELADKTELSGLLNRMLDGYTERTPSGGYHWFYRIKDAPVPGNQKISHNKENQVTVETRGEGGFVIVAPSGGKVHPTGKPWLLVRGSVATIPTFTMQEREAIHNLFRAFNDIPTTTAVGQREAKSTTIDGQLRPGDDYNERMTWDDILTPKGWTKGYTDRAGETYWTRPGKSKSDGFSATTGRGDSDNLFVFSTSTDFKTETPYNKFGAYTHLEHGGDFSAAASALSRDGYGTKGDLPVPELRPDGRIDYTGELATVTSLLDRSSSRTTEPNLQNTDSEVSDPNLTNWQNRTDIGTEVSSIDESSWKPVDLTPFLDGSYEPPTPGLLYRQDGQGLLYPGRVHSFYGESESGKSWLAQIAVAELIKVGKKCIYIDFEAEASDLIGRLRSLGCWDQHMIDSFTYLKPESARDAEDPYWLDLLKPGSAVLVVIDGVTESLTMWGGETKDNDMITRWMRIFPRTISASSGAAVVMIDHVTKNAETRNRFAIGGQAKLATIDGAAYLVEPIDGIAPGRSGSLTIRVTKDRPGYVRKNAGMYRKSDRTQEAAVVTLDSTKSAIEVIISVPRSEEEVFKEKNDQTDQAIIQYIHDNPGCPKTQILRHVTGTDAVISGQIEDLREEGYIQNIGTSHKQQLSLTPKASTQFLIFDDKLPESGVGA